ncbi:glycosyltransferase family 39 protein [Candidatus Woesearchaeota archaeon]|nr:glycosyltransferase family 39 protein [Candidatus Woesearchaeota archaeon]
MKYKIVLIIIILLGLILRIPVFNNNLFPSGDQGSYIEVACNIFSTGFNSDNKVHYIEEDFTTKEISHPDYLRQPLFPLTLAFLFNLFGISFLIAKLPSLVLGLVSIYLTFLVGSSIFNKKIGLFSAFLMAISASQIFYSSMAIAEMLYQTIFLIILFFIYKKEKLCLDWIFIGFFTALLYLTRANALLVIFALVFHILINKNVLKNLACSLLTLFFVNIPWAIRNLNAFGTLTSSWTSKHYFWINDWSEVYMVPKIQPSLTRLLAQNNFLPLIRRFISGFIGNIIYLLQSGELLFMLPLSLLTAFKVKDLKRHSFLYLSLFFHVIFFAWTPYANKRYFMPFIPLFFIFGVKGISLLYHSLKANRLKSFFLISLILIILFQLLGAAYATYKPFSEKELNLEKYQTYEDIISYINSELEPDAVIMSVSDMGQQIYMFNKPLLAIPNNDIETILKVAHHYSANYLIIDKYSLGRVDILSDYFRVEDDILTEYHQFPDIELIHNNKNFLVYRFISSTS